MAAGNVESFNCSCLCWYLKLCVCGFCTGSGVSLAAEINVSYLITFILTV